MTARIPDHIAAALSADDAELLDRIIAERDPSTLNALRRIARNEDGDHDQSQQRKALYALGHWGDPTLVDDIENALPALEAPARIGAIDALGRIGGERSLEIVSRFIDDESSQVRKFVVRALERIGTKDAAITLKKMAGEARHQAWVREVAKEASDGLPKSDAG